MKNLRSQTRLTCLLATACLGLVPAVFAVDPPPDGGYPNANTAEGDGALFSLTTGSDNTAVGNGSLSGLTTGSENTAVGSQVIVESRTRLNGIPPAGVVASSPSAAET